MPKLHAIDPNDPEQTNRPDSRTREVQAESVAYAVCQHYGLDTSEYSFGYVAGWSSGRELAELKASLEIIRSAAHELISALDEHLAELRQQRETELSTAQEAAFALDNGNTLFIQTCDSGYDYTLYGPDNKALDGGQLDAPGLTLPDAGQEALNLLGQTARCRKFCWAISWQRSERRRKRPMKFLHPLKFQTPPQSPRSRFCGAKVTSCRTAKSCRCPWQIVFLKNWTPPSTRTGKRTATQAAGTTRPHSALILP